MTMCQRTPLKWGNGFFVVATLAVLAACGGSADETPTPTSAAPTATSPVPTATSPAAPGETRVPPTPTPTTAIPEPTATRTLVDLGELFATSTPVPSPTPTPTSTPNPPILPPPFYPTGVEDPAEHEPALLSVLDRIGEFEQLITELQDNIAVVRGLLAEYDLLKQRYDQQVVEFVPFWQQFNAGAIGFSVYNAEGDEVRSHWAVLEAHLESLTRAADMIGAPVR